MLIFITLADRNGRKNKYGLYRCSFCDSIKEIRTDSVSSGNTKSCGCRQGFISHGLSKDSLYKVWAAIKQRCLNPDHPKYHRYGGRGITIYSDWILRAEMFIQYVSTLPNAQQLGFSIDQINTEGNYEPGNLRWATSSEQMNNLSLTPRRNSKCQTSHRFDLSFIPMQAPSEHN